MNKKIIDNAKFKFICKYNGLKDMKECITEAILEETHMTESQLARLFDIMYSNKQTPSHLDAWVDEIYIEMIGG